jgi:hypothetical protein
MQQVLKTAKQPTNGLKARRQPGVSDLCPFRPMEITRVRRTPGRPLVHFFPRRRSPPRPRGRLHDRADRCGPLPLLLHRRESQ